jgi:hypothetical protein
MTTTMHRLQISLPEQLFRYLAGRARRDGVSMAEVIRRLLDVAAEAESFRPVSESLSLAETRPAYQTGPQPLLSEVILHLPPDFYQHLRQEADRAGKLVPTLAQEWLAERLAAAPVREPDERARVTEILRASGMLVELDPELRKRADPTISLEKVQAALDRAGGKPLSQIILEQRGPKG